MTDPDERLGALWAEHEPPARDHAFVVAVMEREAQERLTLEVLGLIPAALIALLVCWIAGPALIHAAGGAPLLTSRAIAIAAACLTLVAGAWFLMMGEGEAPWI